MTEAVVDQAAGAAGTEAQLAAAEAAKAPLNLPNADGQQTPTPAVPVAKVEGDAKGEIKVADTGDATLNLLYGFLARNGVNPAESDAVKAATNGDFTLLRAQLAEKNLPGWQEHIAIAEKGYADFLTGEKARGEAAKVAVVDAVGGEEAWAEVHAWAAANADPEERPTINAALNQGGLVAAAVAQFLQSQFRAATGASTNPTGGADASKESLKSDQSTGALSPVAYAKAVEELRRKLGPSMDQSKDYKALQSRRAAYRS